MASTNYHEPHTRGSGRCLELNLNDLIYDNRPLEVCLNCRSGLFCRRLAAPICFPYPFLVHGLVRVFSLSRGQRCRIDKRFHTNKSDGAMCAKLRKEGEGLTRTWIALDFVFVPSSGTEHPPKKAGLLSTRHYVRIEHHITK